MINFLKLIWLLLRIYGIMFCVMSIGYMVDKHVLGNSPDIILETRYFGSLFLKGFISSILCIYFVVCVAALWKWLYNKT